MPTAKTRLQEEYDELFQMYVFFLHFIFDWLSKNPLGPLAVDLNSLSDYL